MVAIPNSLTTVFKLDNRKNKGFKEDIYKEKPKCRRCGIFNVHLSLTRVRNETYTGIELRCDSCKEV